MPKFRTVCGGRWTTDGRWVVINEIGQIVYDPDNWEIPKGEIPEPLLSLIDIWDCHEWIKKHTIFFSSRVT